MCRYGRRFGAAVLLALAGGWAAAAAPTLHQIQRASAHCLAAEKALKSGNLRKARESLEKAIEVLPEFPAAHMGLGHIALTEKRYEDALTEYRAAERLYVGLEGTMMALRASKYADSRTELTEWHDELRKELKFTAPALRLSKLTQKIQTLEQMEPPRSDAAIEAPPIVDFYIGNALFHLSRLEEATAAWESCIRKDEEFQPAWQNLAVGYWMRGEVEEAKKVTERAAALGIQVDPNLKADIAATPEGIPPREPGVRPGE